MILGNDMITIGDIHIHLINAANTLVDGGGAFGLVPRVLWRRYFEPDEQNLIPMSETCLLVQVSGRNIVIDTGLGHRLGERERANWHIDYPGGGLNGGLARLGVSPADVDMVIDTHLHADHCAGNMKFKDDGDGIEPTFPNAEYVVQRREYADAMKPNERTRATYTPENYDPLVQSGQMRLLDGDTDFGSGIYGVVTPGHTPGHMSVRFESGGQQAIFLCDLSSYAVHFERLGWMTAYDVEPLVTMETKRQWRQWVLDHDAIVIFPHDPKRPAGRLTEDERGRVMVEPMDEAYV